MKVVVAMSGGVDSSVAACLLHEQGCETVGLFMRTGVELPVDCDDAGRAARRRAGCCSASDAADARSVAGMLRIPFYALNFEQHFDRLIDDFAAEYEQGRTPNPCIVCNSRLKFDKLFEYADGVGARYVATGHYARIETRNAPFVTGSLGSARRMLCRGIDERKDQSYVLFAIPREGLDRVMFPVGGMTKDQVREQARRFGLTISDKPDSMEICFAPDQDYARVVRERRPRAFEPGNVIDANNRVVGRHRGVGHYTIGQRRGLRIAAGKPIYVTRIDAKTNTVTVGDADALLCRELLADRTHFLVDVPDAFVATAKIRYLHKAAPAKVERLDAGAVRVTFDEPQRAVTPGQAVVFYHDDIVLGGAWIAESISRLSAIRLTAES